MTINLDYENLRSLFSQTPEMLAILAGPEHRFEFVNEAHIKALGFDATGMTVHEAQPESVEIHNILDNVYQTGVTADLHEIPITVTDRLRYFNLTYAPRRTREGKVDGVMVLGTEITEQVLARKSQQNQNSWLKLVLDHIPIPVFLVDPKLSRILFSNRIGKTMFGDIENTVPAERYTKENIQAYQNGKLLSASEIPSARASRGQTFNGEEFFFRTPNGDYWVIASSEILPASFGEEKTVLLVFQDVTELRKSEARLSQAISISKIGFYEWDLVKDSLVYSDQMKEIWGVEDISNYSNKVAVSLMHPEDRERVVHETELAIQQNHTLRTELRINRPDGKMIWVEIRGQAQYNSERAVRFLGTSIDITEQKMISEELNQARVAAEQANAAKSEFLANMSHEIRTPLGAIMGFVELMKKKPIQAEELNAYISIISRNSGQLLHIIDDILDLSKVEAGHMLIERIDFNLFDLLSDFSSLMSFKASEKGIHFEIRAETQLPELINTDPTRLRQILNNIVGNAIKFTEKGSVNLNLLYQDGLLNFIVTDTGVGMSKDQAEKLFRPFSQGDASITRRFGGTGLGLFLTRRLCELLDGNFELIRTAPQKGSSFKASVKVNTVQDTRFLAKDRFEFSSKPVQAQSETLALEGVKILVVDDSSDNRTLISITLSEVGALVDVASNGLEAVEKALPGHYDVILMDLQMPYMDGYEALKALQEKGYQRPVIALTAHAMREEREKCARAGFKGFLTKPLERESLQNEILSKLSVSNPVMVVEDDEDLRALMLYLFSDLKQNAIFMKSAEEALGHLKHHPLPPLVLVDLSLPQMSGEEFIKILSHRPDRNHSKVIITSGWDNLEEKAHALNADGFLKKPFEISQFSSLIKKYLSIRERNL